MKSNIKAAIIHHRTGDTTQDITIDNTADQLTIENQVAAIQAHIRLHIIE